MAEFDKELLENYDELRQSRGWSWEQMAGDLESRDASLAAELRKRHVEEKPAKRTEAPKGRRSAPKSEG